jgi:hypothetical protein
VHAIEGSNLQGVTTHQKSDPQPVDYFGIVRGSIILDPKAAVVTTIAEEIQVALMALHAAVVTLHALNQLEDRVSAGQPLVDTIGRNLYDLAVSAQRAAAYTHVLKEYVGDLLKNREGHLKEQEKLAAEVKAAQKAAQQKLLGHIPGFAAFAAGPPLLSPQGQLPAVPIELPDLMGGFPNLAHSSADTPV